MLLDWLPWNHTFGGNHNIGIALYNGGSFYIDEGKPGPGFIEETIRNLREISPPSISMFPKATRTCCPLCAPIATVRENFFRRLRLLFYAGAGLSQPVWDAYRRLALETCGERIIMVTGLGSTETAPMAIQATWETDRAGVIGIPIPGVEAKLVPQRRQNWKSAFVGPISHQATGASPNSTESFRRRGLLQIRRCTKDLSIPPTSTKVSSSTAASRRISSSPPAHG